MMTPIILIINNDEMVSMIAMIISNDDNSIFDDIKWYNLL